ncbi:hypothetical protein ACQ858_19680 [Variovorax ureilyticus]|uniref:hypothetical protein n=1 Tax=Variovorax ureilyticus TaxID=1836198 RepID=UPI003D66F9E0
MSRPDLYPHDREQWANTGYIADLRANHDRLAERTRSAASGRGGTGWSAAVFAVVITVVVVALARACAPLSLPLCTEHHTADIAATSTPSN